ncbi:hypothetical protein SDC9_140205 [bioreactor metagenome]|uniref:Uncharacterized protein n=1 Tax=bioreactor metagenome TaxID=1076179 RepID=A0A645DUU6_9ZZZZ
MEIAIHLTHKLIEFKIRYIELVHRILYPQAFQIHQIGTKGDIPIDMLAGDG